MKRKRTKSKSSNSSPGILPDNDERNLLPNQTDGFHVDERATVVLIGGKIYDLVESDDSFDALLRMSPYKRPHVRYLNPILARTKKAEQEKNANDEALHKILDKHELLKKTSSSKKVTSVKKAMDLGVDVSDEVQKLLDLKDKTKDPAKKSKIRSQLRKLNYKRYIK